MFIKHSIRQDFLIQIIISTLALIFAFSLILYFFIEKSIYDEKHEELLKYAQNISNYQSLFQEDENFSENFFSLNIEIIYLINKDIDISQYEKTVRTHTYLTLIYPFDLKNNAYLKITKDISSTKKLLSRILRYIFFINIAGFLLVILYSLTLSKMLVRPIKILSAKLSNITNTCYGYVNGLDSELGYFDLSELEAVYGPLGLSIERDVSFEPTPFATIKKNEIYENSCYK